MFTLCHINPKYYPVGSLLILFWHREVINIYLCKHRKFSYMAFAIVVSFWNALPTQLLCKTLKHHHTRKLPFTFFMRIPEISFLCVKCRTSRYSCLTSRLALRGPASDLGCAFMCVWETLHLDRVSGGPEFWSLLCLLLEAISELELGLSSLFGDTCMIQPMLQVQAVRTMLPQSPQPSEEAARRSCGAQRESPLLWWAVLERLEGTDRAGGAGHLPSSLAQRGCVWPATLGSLLVHNTMQSRTG